MVVSQTSSLFLTPEAYLPIDRYLALAKDIELPEQSEGAVLFADISGFTQLTEKLTENLGSRRGAEELTQHLNLVYTALVTQVHLYQGSVIYFSGDAITCWFDANPPVISDSTPDYSFGLQQAVYRTITAAIALQEIMSAIKQPIGLDSQLFFKLALKVTVAAGTVRRFIVGDPQIQRFDLLVGAPLERLSQAEHVARKGEVIVAPEIAALLGDLLQIQEWRLAQPSNNAHNVNKSQLFGVVRELKQKANFQSWTKTIPKDLRPSKDKLRPWLLPEVAQRLEAGLDEFLTEIRPAVSLFMRFDGLDYEDDAAVNSKLDSFIRWVQSILKFYEGSLIQITVGDKGSYLYACFGAPVAHQNDAERAVWTALVLLNASKLGFQIQLGISQGTMRTGAYGSPERATYGVLGDEVNLAARLMQAAQPNQILVSGRIHKAVNHIFNWQSLPPLQVKGKSEPITVFRLLRNNNVVQPSGAIISDLWLDSPSSPLIGRRDELNLLLERLSLVEKNNKAQIVALLGEAGIGKTRLLTEIARLASSRSKETGVNQQWVIYSGSCLSYGTNTPYLVWRSLFMQLLKLNSTAQPEEQIGQIIQEVTLLDPTLLPRLPLLGDMLGLSIVANDLTKTFDARLRKISLENLLLSLLEARSKLGPVLLLLEDCHWLDALSRDLLEALGRIMVDRDFPLLLIISSRPTDNEPSVTSYLANLPILTEIQLKELSSDEAKKLVMLKLNQTLPAKIMPAEVIERLITRAEGNPFYLEELVNLLRDRSIDFEQTNLATVLLEMEAELPSSLHSLILSRIDRISESEKALLKVASVIGRAFQANWLWGVYAGVGEPHATENQLTRLEKLDLILFDTQVGGNQTYLFKHAITKEVIYESLTLAQREYLHEQVGLFIEKQYSDNTVLLEITEQYSGLRQELDLLAYHFGHSNNRDKQLKYFFLAAQAAQANYSNTTAINYYKQLLDLLLSEIKKFLAVQEPVPKVSSQDVNMISQNSKYNIEELQEVAQKFFEVSYKLGQVLRLVGRWLEAAEIYRQGLALIKTDYGQYDTWQAKFNLSLAEVLIKQGQYKEAIVQAEQARSKFEALNDQIGLATCLDNQGQIAHRQSDYKQAEKYYQQSLKLRLEIGEKTAIANSFNNLGIVSEHQGNYDLAAKYYQESLQLRQELGDKFTIAESLTNLCTLANSQGKYQQAQSFEEQSLAIRWEIGYKQGIAISLNNLGVVAEHQANYKLAHQYYQESLRLRQELGDKPGMGVAFGNLALAEIYLNNYQQAQNYYLQCLTIMQELGSKWGIAMSFGSLGLVAFLQSDYVSAFSYYKDSLELFWDIGDKSQTCANLAMIAAICFNFSKEYDSIETQKELMLLYHRQAAILCGCVSVHIKALGAAMQPLENKIYLQTLEDLKTVFDRRTLHESLAKGHEFTLEQGYIFAFRGSVMR